MHLVTKFQPALLLAFLFSSLAAQVSPPIQQLDTRFGSVGREAAVRLGLQNYREYQRQNDAALLAGKQKHFVVGQVTNRNDALGADWEWYVLDLFEQPQSLLLQHFLNLALDVINSDAMPVVRDLWRDNHDDLEALWVNTVNGTSKTWKKKVLGVTVWNYTVRLSNTRVSIPYELPEIQLTVAPNGEEINFSVSTRATWSTHARGSSGTLHAEPTFDTDITILGTIAFGEDERGRYLYVKDVQGRSVTDAQGDIVFWVNFLNIGNIKFTWRKIDLIVQSQIDRAIAGAIGKIKDLDLNNDGQPELAQRFYFESYISKLLFEGRPLPRQQEIIDRIFAQEENWIRHKIEQEGHRGARWEIGNEPNWFPIMRPERYAEIYSRYYNFIKSLDPSATCMIGGLFFKEAIENPRDIVLSMIPLLLGAFREELATFVTNSLFETTTASWLETFYVALPAPARVDIGNFHLYPMRAQSTAFDLAQVRPPLEALAASFRSHGASEVWITEMGNIDWRRNENEVAAICTQLSDYLKNNQAGIGRWFWSRSVGYDRRFDAIGRRPISALFADDGTITAIGRAYEQAASSFNDNLTAGGQNVLASPAHLLATLPQSLTLSPSYPNPFSVNSPSNTIRIPYALPEAAEIELSVYDLMGRLAKRVVVASREAGWHEAIWDGRTENGSLATSGVYFTVLRAGAHVQKQRLVITK